MQLDKTQIVIRERSYIDILDLSLRVIRAYAGPLCLALLTGIVPFFLLNAWLLSGLVGTGIEVEIDPAYGYLLIVLVIWELPLATAPATLFLGRVLFQQEPLPGKDAAVEITRGLWRSAPQLFFYQVLLRPLLVFPVFTWLWLFSARPYLNEVLLLERNPFWQRSPQKPSTARRVRALHSAHTGYLLGRWFAALAIGLILFVVFSSSALILHGMLFDAWEMETLVVHYSQLALWLVVGFFAVVRYLGYLDLRIRREGWEVELLLRSEHHRLTETTTAM